MTQTRTAGSLAQLAGATVVGDPSRTILRVSSVDEAGPGALTFAVDERWLARAVKSGASAIVVPRAIAPDAADGSTLLVADDARAALAAILATFAKPLPAGEFTHPTAIVGERVRRGARVYTGPGVIISDDASIGDDVVLMAGAYVGRAASIGPRTLVHPRAVVLDECAIGADCILHSGCVIGSDGFGFVRIGDEQIKIPQIGNVEIGDRVEVGANTTIDRAVTGTTSIGADTKIDNLVQIAHNVQIGESCTICAQTGIAGSTKIGRRTTLAGQAGIGGHIEIGAGSLVLGQCGVSHSLPPNSVVFGTPAQPHREELKQKVLLRNLPKVVEELRSMLHAASRRDDRPQ